MILCALGESELEATKNALQSIRKDIEVFCRGLDVRDSSAVSRFVHDAAEWAGGRIDILCCNVGVSPPIVPIAGGDPDRWWTAFEMNVRGPYLFARHVLRDQKLCNPSWRNLYTDDKRYEDEGEGTLG